MVRIWASMLAGALVLVLSFQNCSEQKAATPAPSTTDVTVEGTDEPETPTEEPVEEEQTPAPQATTATHLEFGYDEVNDTYAYSLALGNGNLIVTNTSDGSMAKELTNEERSLILQYFTNPLRSDSNPNHDANFCDIGEYQQGTYARILTDNPAVIHVLNQAAFDCGGKDFATAGGAPERIQIDVGGVMTLLVDVLADQQDSIENP